jgi:hypothetical protein
MDLLEGPMAGKTLEGDLVKAIQNGEAYVNVRTAEIQMVQFVDR